MQAATATVLNSTAQTYFNIERVGN